MEWVQNQKVLITRHKTVGVTNDSDFQQLVIFGIATNSHQARQFNMYGAEAQVGHKRPAGGIPGDRELGRAQAVYLMSAEAMRLRGHGAALSGRRERVNRVFAHLRRRDAQLGWPQSPVPGNALDIKPDWIAAPFSPVPARIRAAPD